MAKRYGKKRTKAGKSTRYARVLCGLAVTIDRTCGYSGTCDIICFGEERK